MPSMTVDQIKRQEAEVEASRTFIPPDVQVGTSVNWYAHNGSHAFLGFVMRVMEKGIKLLVVGVDGAEMSHRYKQFVRHKDDPQAKSNAEGSWDHTPHHKAMLAVFAHIKEYLDHQQRQDARMDKLEKLTERVLKLENLMGK